MIVLGSNEKRKKKKKCHCAGANEWSFGPKPLDISSRSYYDRPRDRQSTNPRSSSSTVINDFKYTWPGPLFHLQRERKKEREREREPFSSINISNEQTSFRCINTYIFRLSERERDETNKVNQKKENKRTLALVRFRSFGVSKSSTKRERIHRNPAGFRYIGPFFIEECFSVDALPCNVRAHRYAKQKRSKYSAAFRRFT